MGRRKLAATLTMLLILVGAAAYQQRAMADDGKGRHRFPVVARETNVQFLRAAGNQPGPLSPGDRFVVRSDLLRGNEVVGEDHVSCTAMFDGKVLCNSTYALDGQGALMGQGLVQFGATNFDVAIVGGTDRYRKVRGVVHITLLQAQPRAEQLRFELVS